MVVTDPRQTGEMRYAWVARALRQRILDGNLKSGERLSPQHDLAREFGVAFNTLKQALDLLEREGYVIRKTGVGTFAMLPGGQHGSILVVDDDPHIGELFVKGLNSNGWSAEAVESGPEALVRLQEASFNAIFLDLVMPEMDGVETLRRIREMHGDIPVVIITAYPDSELLNRALEIRPFTMIKKPCSLHDIRTVLRSLSQSRV